MQLVVFEVMWTMDMCAGFYVYCTFITRCVCTLYLLLHNREGEERASSIGFHNNAVVMLTCSTAKKSNRCKEGLTCIRVLISST